MPAATILFVMMFSKIKRLGRRVIGLFFLPLSVESILGPGIHAPSVSFTIVSFICAVYSLDAQPRFSHSKYSGNQSKILPSTS